MRKRARYLTKTAAAVTLSLSMALSPAAAGLSGAGVVLAAEDQASQEDETDGRSSETGQDADDSALSEADAESGAAGESGAPEANDEEGSSEETGDLGDGALSDEDDEPSSETDEDADTEAPEETDEEADTEASEETDEDADAETSEETDETEDREKDSEDGENADDGEEESKPVTVEDAEEEQEELLEALELELYDDEDLLYDWESEWEEDIAAGDIWTRLNFSSSDDPAVVMGGFGTGDSKNNIEGPEGSNCFLEGAKNWRDNGNLMVVDLATASDAEKIEKEFDERYAETFEADFEEAAETARMSLGDTHVFRYYLHDLKDWDRNTSITDRQRIEIKTEAKNADVNSYEGEILTNRWKFFLPEYYEEALPYEGSFFHIFQTKATQGDESSMPVFTLSVTEENLYLHGADCGHVNQVEYEMGSVDIGKVLGRWIEAEITTYTAEKGYVYVKLQDVSDPTDKVVLLEEGHEMDSWRRPEKLMEDNLYHEYDAPALASQMNRSKWGLYRKNDTPSPFKDMAMYLGDLQIIKRDADSYIFPDGFDPKEQARDVSWAVSPEPVKVLEGTDFSNIYLPGKVNVYVEAHDVETLPVTWEAGDYDQSVKGTYTAYGTLHLEDGIENPDNVKASVQIIVTDEAELSQKRVNWALGKEAGGTAQVKTVGGSASNPSSCLIDGSENTWWATHSGLIAVNTEDNGGYRYWAAVDLGEERTFDEIYLALGTIGSSKQFRLKNYSMYYTEEAEAYEELEGGITGNPREKNVTPDPLGTEHGSSWEMIPGVYRTNADGAKQVTNNIKHTHLLEEALTARYILVYGEIENVDATAGAIQAKVLKVIGNKACEDIPEIVQVEHPKQLVVEPGTDFASLGLPTEVQVSLADGTTAAASVAWQQDEYQKDQEGSYRIAGTLIFPDDQMQNPEYLKAYASVIVSEVQSAERVNWATAEQGASLKVVSDANPKAVPTVGYLIDGKDETSWDTHSSLIPLGDQCTYWAALDLGETRSVDQIRLAWGTTSNRLKNYAVYYAEESEAAEAAFGQLNGTAGTINEITEVTTDPLAEEGFQWRAVDGMRSDSVVTKGTSVNQVFDEAITCRYLLLRSEVDSTKEPGAVRCTLFEAWGGSEAEKTEIAGAIAGETVRVAYGTPFGEIDLPETAEVALEDGSVTEVPVIWNSGTYSRTQTGTVWVSGTLLCPPTIANSAAMKASIQINIEGEEIARKAAVVFMSSVNKEYCRYENVIVGSKISAPVNAPQQEGYLFGGWYRDAACTIGWDYNKDRLTAAGLILYAKWLEDTEEEPEEPATDHEPEQNGGSGNSGSGSAVSGGNGGSWHCDAKGWWFSFPDGSYPYGTWKKLYWNGKERWYYFEADGYMKTGWHQDPDGNWYYLNPVSDGTQGEMWVGRHNIDGTWYYFNPNADGTQGAWMMESQDHRLSRWLVLPL